MVQIARHDYQKIYVTKGFADKLRIEAVRRGFPTVVSLTDHIEDITTKPSSSSRKRGNISLDANSIILTVFIFAVLGICAYYLLGSIYTNFVDPNDQMNSEDKVRVLTFIERLPGFFDGFVIFIFVGLLIGGILAAYFIQTQPAFVVVSIIVGILSLMISPYIANAYVNFVETQFISAAAAQFTKSLFLFRHLLEISIISLIILNVVHYGKGT